MPRPPWAKLSLSNSRLEPFDVAQAQLLQNELRKKIIVADDFLPLKFLAGVDIGFTDDGATTRAAVVVVTFPEMELVETSFALLPTTVPYISGFLSFREIPAALQAFAALKQRVQCILVDGMGIAHPRRLGVASHLGLLLNLPTIGVGKSRLVGSYTEVSENAGDAVELTDKNEQIGWVLRSKKKCLPLFISPGHKVGMNASLNIVHSCLRGYKLPEPTRLADRLASRKGPLPEITNKVSNPEPDQNLGEPANSLLPPP